MWASIQNTQRQNMMRAAAVLAAVPLPALKEAAERAGIAGTAEGIERLPDPGTTLLERLRALPEHERRQLIIACANSGASVLRFLQTARSQWGSAALVSFLYVLIALYILQREIEDSLPK